MAWMQPQLTSPPMGPTDEIRKLQRRLLAAYGKNSRAKEFGVTESGVFDVATSVSLTVLQKYIVNTKEIMPGLGKLLVLRDDEYGVLTYDTKLALGVFVLPPAAPPPTHVCFSVAGTAANWDMGYPWDLANALDKRFWTPQGIGYPATAFPMRTSYNIGVESLLLQLDRYGCEHRTWAVTGYSQGAIVTSKVLQRVLTGDLQRYKDTFIGGVHFGNPMREEGKTVPGGIDPGGKGIVLPNLVGTPDSVWEMAAGKDMVGSPGNDLYTTCGSGISERAANYQRSIWDIVDNKKITSFGKAILDLGLSPTFDEGIGAAEAAFGALNFFVVKGITPHTSYHLLQPIPGDGRDSWRVGLDHLNDIGARTPVRV